MPIFQLTDDIIFPPPELAQSDGLLAVGGDLSTERLLLAYSMGIFPWYTPGSPLLWWSTDPRLILLPDELKISRSLRAAINQARFEVTFDTDFKQVITACADVHSRRDDGTWITSEMFEAYNRLHELGHAHSTEVWQDGTLVGGLYGISMGGVFFGESMFHTVTDASKVAFALTVKHLKEKGFTLIDCQMTTKHLLSFGAKEIPREDFIRQLGQEIKLEVSF